MESQRKENWDNLDDLPPRHQRLSRRRSFSERLEDEMKDLQRQLDEAKGEIKDLEERWRQEREENQLLKKRIDQCPACSTGPTLPTIVQHIAEDLCVPQVETDQFQGSPAQADGIDRVKEPQEDSTASADRCGLCSYQFQGQYKVKYCHECDRFKPKARMRCDSFDYLRSRSRRLKSV